MLIYYIKENVCYINVFWFCIALYISNPYFTSKMAIQWLGDEDYTAHKNVEFVSKNVKNILKKMYVSHPKPDWVANSHIVNWTISGFGHIICNLVIILKRLIGMHSVEEKISNMGFRLQLSSK